MTATATAVTAASVAAAHPNLFLEAAEVRGPRGTVFGPITAQSNDPVTVVLGASGTGRTSLLLSLGGRMKLSAGQLGLRGFENPAELKDLRGVTGVVGFHGLDELEPSVSVGASIRERLSWALPWYRFAPRVTDALALEILRPTFGDVTIPGRRTLVRDLTGAQDLLLRVALARIESPEVLLVDNFDSLTDPAERAQVASRLRALADRGVASIVATADERDLALLGAERAAIHLG